MLQDNVIDKNIEVDGITYSYDTTRNKWLSFTRCCIQFGLKHKNVSSPRWLSMIPGTYSNNTGYLLFQQGTILYVTAKTKNISDCEFKIYEDTETNGLIELFSIELENEKSKIETKDVDVSAGEIKCKLICGRKVDYPNISIQGAFRL